MATIREKNIVNYSVSDALRFVWTYLAVILSSKTYINLQINILQ